MKNKLRLNNIISLIYQFISIIIGLIIPRLILEYYGSTVNGYVYSISQMLSIITYFDFGVTAVAQAALYAPIVKNDSYQISKIYYSVKRYFDKLLIILLIYVILLSIFYSFFQVNSFNWIYSLTLVIAISISLFGQFIWGISNQVLLAADQKNYIYTILNIVTTILNGIFTYLLIINGFSIQAVKLVSSLIFICRPILLNFYVKKTYNLFSITEVPKYVLPNRFSGIVQHISTTLISSLDTIVLTIFSNFSEVSVYNIYTFPLNGMRLIFESVSSGYKGYFGHQLANDIVNEDIISEFRKFSFISGCFANIFLCVSMVSLPSFIKLYTAGINDATYFNPLFSIMIILSYYFMMIRIPYTTIINAAGHFKQTQRHNIIEILINVIFSVFLVKKMGLTGVAIGTCLAVLYRILASIYYLTRNIINIPLLKEIKNQFTNFIIVMIFYFVSNTIKLNMETRIMWVLGSLGYTVLCIIIIILVNIIFNRDIFLVSSLLGEKNDKDFFK